jgi:hypothetical protein
MGKSSSWSSANPGNPASPPGRRGKSKLLKALKLINKSVAYDFRKIRPKRSGDAGMEHFIGNEAVQGGEHHLDMVGVTSTS